MSFEEISQEFDYTDEDREELEEALEEEIDYLLESNVHDEVYDQIVDALDGELRDTAIEILEQLTA